MNKVKLGVSTFITVIIVLTACVSDVKLKKEHFEKTELGMTPEEVKAILGEPDEIRPSVDSDSNYFYYITNTPLKTDYAEVYFNKSRRVSFLHYGKID